MKIILFHNPDEENGYLSNWYLSNFKINDITFTSMEQYMMYEKAICFNDYKIAEEILNTKDVKRIKELGRLVNNYNDHIWNGIRQIIIYKGLFAKYSQNNELKEKLLNTENAILVECAENDRIWAVGLSMKDPNRFDINKWNGQNLLGYATMLVRNDLKK